MIAQSSETNEQPVGGSVRGSQARASTGRLTTYELCVVAPRVDDVVRSAGGWLFDRVMAGWAVNFLVPDGCDLRPLTVLGVRAVPFESGFESLVDGPQGASLAMAADAFLGDARVRKAVTKAVERGRTEVTVWGDGCPGELRKRMTSVQHRLSAAAHVFKAQALMAAGAAASDGSTENFLSCACWHPSGDSDLLPVS